ncbi:MAG: hypothetical protein IT243_02575 [Bacteroidia bacterium]|nr:hypothetical protein [Bacteroidia bacterium]
MILLFNSCNQKSSYDFNGLKYNKLLQLSEAGGQTTQYLFDINEDGYLDKFYLISDNFIYSLHDSLHYIKNKISDTSTTQFLIFDGIHIVDGKTGKRRKIDIVTTLDDIAISDILNSNIRNGDITYITGIYTTYNKIRVNFGNPSIDEFYVNIDVDNAKLILSRIVLKTHWQNYEETACIIDTSIVLKGSYSQISMNDIWGILQKESYCKTFIDTFEYNKIRPR